MAQEELVDVFRAFADLDAQDDVATWPEEGCDHGAVPVGRAPEDVVVHDTQRA